MTKTKCSICGEPTSSTTRISDRLFVIEPNSIICTSCFHHFASGDDTYLIKKLMERAGNSKNIQEFIKKGREKFDISK